MKSIIIGIVGWLALVFFPNFAKGAGPETFQMANEALTKGDTKTAVEAYESIRAAGQHSPELYLNMAKAYKQLGQTGRAMLAYERGLRLRPTDARFLDQVEAMEKEKMLPPSNLFEFRSLSFFSNWNKALPSDTWAIWAVVLGWLCVGAGFWRWRSKHVFAHKFGWPIAIALGFCAVFALMMAVFAARFAGNKDYGIVLQKETKVFPNPDTHTPEAETLQEGSKVKILDAMGEWYKIELTTGETGWAQQSAVAII